ncbi:type I restriction enzyme, S subunit [Polaromonas sp. OV174]|uniref:restriction endonuclease subunit S n=1 Tax=Polaromonas sp. OV174 TaxID=1855300 RepID=UPI0008EAA497|nr:restriction endonuclease subunit S [Polaromonas sp. OV174]SFC33849.1 type I restriction enzyme, S subunit [Polaromonas sp. OV174]
MKGWPTRSIQTLVNAASKAKQPSSATDVWNLNLDQIEAHGGRVLEKVYISPKKLGPSTFAFEPRTVLYSKLRPYLNKVVVADEAGFATTELVPLRCNPDEVHPEYLAYFLRSEEFLRFATEVVAGAKMPRMVMSAFWDFQVPLPPLPEQHRIAAILDQADALRTKRREALAQMDSLTQSIFMEMFGDRATNPKVFPKFSIGSIAKISTGSTPSRSEERYYGGEIPWVKTTEIAGEDIWTTEEKLTDTGFKAIRGKLHPINSIIVAMYGQGQTRGRSALLKVEATCNQACGVIYPSQDFSPTFMFHQIQIAYGELRALGRGGNQENLNLQLLGAFEILLPSMVLQQTFATRIQAIDDIKANHRAALSELDELFASIQHRAFKGEL